MAGFGEFVKSGNGGGTPTPSTGGGGSFGDFVKSGASSKGVSSSGGKKSTFLGIDLPKLPLVHWDLPAIGMHKQLPSPLAQGREMVAGAVPGLFRLGGSLASEAGLTPGGLAETVKGISPAYQHSQREKKKAAGFTPGWHNVKKDMPVTAELVTSPARTVREIPDTLGAVRPGGPGFGQSMLGREIQQHGVLPTVLNKAVDVTMLAGGVGALGKVAGAGTLAEAEKGLQLAKATSKAAGVATDAAKLDAAATTAAAAGDVGKASDLARAAEQVRTYEQAAAGATRAERATLRASQVQHLGGKVAAAPFVPTEKALGLLGKGAGLALKSERLAPLAERAAAATDRAKLRLATSKLFHDKVTAPYQAHMHTVIEKSGILDSARNLSADEQVALYLSKSQEFGDPAVRQLVDKINELPEEVRPDAVAKLFPRGDVTAEHLELARRFQDGTLEPKQQERMQQAADRTTAVQGEREAKNYVTARGEGKELSQEGLRAREQRARGEAADMDVEAVVERKTRATRNRIAGIEDEANRLDTETPEPVPYTRHQERRLGAVAERVRRAEATQRGEVARGQRLMESAGREVERAQTRAQNRTGQVIGRARGRLEEAGQLETGLARRQRADALKARRLEREATVAEERASKLPAPKEPEAARNKRVAAIDKKLDKAIDARDAAQRELDTVRTRDRGENFDTLSDAGLAEYRSYLRDQEQARRKVGVAQDEVDRLHASRRAEFETPAAAPKPAAPKLTAKQRAESTAAAKRVAADEAQAGANKLQGVNPAPSRSKVLSDVNLDAQRAHTANKVETETTSELLAKEAKRQKGAVARAQKKLERARSDEASTIDRYEREAGEKAARAVERRQAVLDERRTTALDKLAREADEARNSVEAAPPQDRPALQVNRRAKELALELAEAHPDRAPEFAALADEIADTKAKLEAKGIKTEFFFGGHELGDVPNAPTAAKLRKARGVNNRARKEGVLIRSLKGQVEKQAQETLGILHNEFRGHAQEAWGSKVSDELGQQRFATGEELAQQLDDASLVAWDPKTGKLLEPGEITNDSAVLPKELHGELTKWTTVRKPGALLKVYDRATGVWKHSVLALSPRWHAGNIIGNAALATLGAGLTPAQIVSNLGEARRLVKEFERGGDVPAEHVDALGRILAAGFHVPDLGSVEVTGKIGKALSKSYEFNEYVDSVNRTMIYLAKHKSGLGAEAAVDMALKAAGDFSNMTRAERTIARRIIPFYAWQRHITRLALSLPIEHPARVAWTLHLADLENTTHPDAGKDNSFNEGTIPVGFNLDLGPLHIKKGDRINLRSADPYGSSFFVDPTVRGLGYQLNPVIKAGVALGLGSNLNREGKKIASKGNKGAFGEGPEGLYGFKHPADFGRYLAQYAPQTRQIQDLLAGNAPVRYDTGEPRKVGKGATKPNAKPTLTGRGRLSTLLRIAGVPFPEPEQKQTTKKKR